MITASNENKTVTRNGAFKEIKPAELIIDRSDKCDNGDINNPETDTETTKSSDAITTTPHYNLRQEA